MILDVGTIVFITSIIFATQTIAFFVQYKVNKSYNGLGLWLTGAILQSVGFFLMLTLHSTSVRLLSIFANPFIFSGQVVLYVGIMQFLDKKVNTWALMSLFLAFIFLYFYFVLIDNSILGRSMTVSVSAAIISFLMAYSLFHVEKGRFSGSATFTASVFMAYGACQAVITVMTSFFPRMGSYEDLYQNPIRISAFIIPIVGSMLWSFGFIIMVNQRLNAENLEEKEKLQIVLKEVHHRIKNNMNTMMSLLNLQAGKTKDNTTVAALEDASKRLQSMEVLYDQLYRSPGFTTLSIKEYLTTLVDEILANFPGKVPVEVNKEFDDFPMDAKRLQPLGIIANELLTNVMKYAFAGRESGKIKVSATLTAGHVVFIVQDNGNGIPESVDIANSTGFGLMLVHSLTTQLNGTIRIERGDGTRVLLDFKL